MKLKKMSALFLSGTLVCFLFSASNVLADSLQKAINVITGISVYVNNVPIKATNFKGNPTSFYHDGAVYVDVQEIASALGQNARWDQNTRSYYIGDQQLNAPLQSSPPPQQKAAYLLDVCPPYQAFDFYGQKKADEWGSPYRTPETITVSGKKYEKSFILGGYEGASSSPKNGWALYNLDGKYSIFSFDVGHIDGHKMHNGIVKIYLDGKKVFEETIFADSLPKHYNIELTHAKQMKIEFVQDSFNYKGCNGKDYAFINATIR